MKPRTSPTIHDVARKAGVSKSLVSLVIQDSPSVREEKRLAVLEAIDQLGYRPNAMARSLVRRRTSVIGAVLSDIHNPFFTELVDAIEDATADAGYRALFTTGSRDPEREAVAVATLLELRVDGLVLAGPVLTDSQIESAGGEVAVVVVGSQPEVPSIDVVSNDDRHGASLLVDHLTSLGHTRIAHIDGGAGAGARARSQGFLDRARHHGLEGAVTVIPGAYTEEGGARGVAQLLENDPFPTAIFAANDLAAVGALHALEATGLRVPQDVSLVGYDNTALAGLKHVSLTTVNQPQDEIGRTAIDLLIERLDESRTEPRRISIDPDLVIRSTTAPPRS